MRNKFLYGLIGRNLLFLTVTALLIVVPQVTEAQSAQDATLVPVEQSSISSELWKLGFTVEGHEPTYNDIIGRILDEAAFRSFRDRDIYQVFPGPATSSIIKSARFRIGSQTGTYDGNVTLTLETHEHKTGVLRHIISRAGDGWELTPGVWTPLILSGPDLQIGPDELLAFHFQLSGNKGGDLDIRPQFEVEVQLPDAVDKDINGNKPVSREIWRSGFTVEGSASYEFIEGRLAGVTADVRSNRGVADIYYVFPAPANLTTLQSAKLYILNRTGSYEGNTNLILEIINEAGTPLRTVSAARIDHLETAAAERWTPIVLSGSATDLNISPGEFLAAKINFDQGPGGDLDLRLLFEVETASSETISTEEIDLHLPVILK